MGDAVPLHYVFVRAISPLDLDRDLGRGPFEAWCPTCEWRSEPQPTREQAKDEGGKHVHEVIGRDPVPGHTVWVETRMGGHGGYFAVCSCRWRSGALASGELARDECEAHEAMVEGQRATSENEGANRMTLADVGRRLVEIQREADRENDGSAHAKADGLYRDILRAIAEGATDPNPAALALAALKADDIDFHTWFE